MDKFTRKRGGTNPSAGGAFPEESQLNNYIRELKESVSPMEKQESSLDTIDAIVGRPQEQQIPRELLIPAPEEWNIFPKASLEKIREMSESIRQYGLFHNITVWKQPDGKYMILGGHTRVACFDYLSEEETDEQAVSKWREIPALVYGSDQIQENDAHRIFIVSNTDQREISIKTKAKAYACLFQLEKEKAFYGSHIDSMASAAAQANTSKSGFFRYLSLLKLIPELQDAVSNGKLTLMVGYYLSLLDKELQQYIYNQELYLSMSTQTASQLRDCETLEDMKNKLYIISHAAKYYKYNIQTRKQKPAGKDVLPIFVDKDTRNETANLYIEAVTQSNFEQDVKDRLIGMMKDAFI